jgi:7-cyano-7-deazaguanine synthase in queuosine biosynthesis
MLSLALAWAEVLGSRDIFVGVNAVDYSGYPDCRPEYIAAFETMANLATKAGVEGHKLIHPRAADRPVEGRDHPPGSARRRLQPDRFLLPGR